MRDRRRGRHTRAAVKAGLVVGLAMALLPASPLGQPTQSALPPKALDLARHHPKLSDSLLVASGATSASPQVASAARVRAIIEPLAGRADALSESALAALGVRVEARSRSLLRVSAPLASLHALAALPGVRYVRPPTRFQAAAPLVNQAVTPIGATLLHGFDVQGEGVRVAVIDVGFASLEFAQQQGALPAEVVADFTDYANLAEPFDNHGTAVALIVHQVAPRAALYLKQVNDEVDLENAVDDAIRQGIDVVNHSVGWTNTNFSDGTGFIAQLAQRAQDAGILWVNAAGNHAQNHWTGRFVDENHDGWSDFPGSDEEALRIPAYFGLISVSLTWDDWPATSQDLDLYLYNSAGQVVAASTNWQTGFEPPVESIEFLVPAPDAFRVKVFARRVSKPVKIKLFSNGANPLFPHTPYGSLLAPADAEAAFAVAAVSIHNWAHGPQQAFSSLGPTSDGRIKPDISGPDMVRNLLQNPFGGTSAAAPHVAGAAALLLSQHPRWDVATLKRALSAYVRDLGQPGKDVVYGAGALDLGLVQLQATRQLSAVRVTPGQSLTVTLRTRVPALTFSELALVERVPEGWTIASDDPAFDPARGGWFFPMLQQGAEVEVAYTLTVPPAQAPGTYRLSGEVNGATIDGHAEVEVVSPSSSNTADERDVPPDAETLTARKPPVTLRQVRTGYEFQAQETQGGLRLTVYDLAGKKVFEDESGGHTLRWNGLTVEGQTAANGVYLAIVRAADSAALGGTFDQVFQIMWLR